MEALQFSTVISRHFSKSSSHNRTYSCSTKLSSSFTSSPSPPTLSSKTLLPVIIIIHSIKFFFPFIALLPFSFLFLSQDQICGLVKSKRGLVKRNTRGLVIRAEMFGQLTSGLESAWSKLKGEGKT